MEKYGETLKKVLTFVLSIIIYFILYFIIIYFLSSNDYVINFILKINNYFLIEPKYLILDDVIIWRLPFIYLVNSIFLLFIFLFFNKILIIKNLALRKIKIYLVYISVFICFVLFLNYLKSFNDNKKIIDKYHMER
jgi:hypothetical protein